MNEGKSKNYLYILAAAIGIIMAIAAAYYFGGRSSTDSPSGIQADTNQSVAELKEQSTNAQHQFDAVGRELDSAGEAAGRANELIEASQERAKEDATSLAECRRIAGQCKAISEDIQRIMREADEAAGGRATTGSQR